MKERVRGRLEEKYVEDGEQKQRKRTENGKKKNKGNVHLREKLPILENMF